MKQSRQEHIAKAKNGNSDLFSFECHYETVIWLEPKALQIQKSVATNTFHVTVIGVKLHSLIPQHKIESACLSSLEQKEGAKKITSFWKIDKILYFYCFVIIGLYVSMRVCVCFRVHECAWSQEDNLNYCFAVIVSIFFKEHFSLTCRFHTCQTG